MEDKTCDVFYEMHTFRDGFWIVRKSMSLVRAFAGF